MQILAVESLESWMHEILRVEGEQNVRYLQFIAE